MAYSKGYNTVVAGRVREDEDSFNKNNKSASPARVYSMKVSGGKKQPKIDKDFIGTEFVGKKEHRTTPELSAGTPYKYNS